MAVLVAYNPTDKSKEYFNSPINWWNPLADFLFDKCPDLFPQGESEYWYSQDGRIVTEELAVRIATRLNQLIGQGVIRRYEEEFLINYPSVRCGFCGGTVVRNKTKCMACDGERKVRQRFFTEENVKRFAEFCGNSDGFDINDRMEPNFSPFLYQEYSKLFKK